MSPYDVDNLFRSDKPDPRATRTYLAQLVSARTGIPQADAEKRVDDAIARVKAAEIKAKQAADAARKAAAEFGASSADATLVPPDRRGNCRRLSVVKRQPSA